MKKLIWATAAWEDYLYWQQTDKQKVKRISRLLKVCLRTPFEGIGKPEALKGRFKRLLVQTYQHGAPACV